MKKKVHGGNVRGTLLFIRPRKKISASNACIWSKSGITQSDQHGFRKNQSTTSNLVTYTSEITKALENGHEVHAVYTDFSKAFDKVSHRVLIDRLHNFGFSGSMLGWISSYLKDRELKVLFNGKRSSSFKATSGVPAGTHGGPDLFLLMINSLVDSIETSNISMYADDSKIFKVINGIEDCVGLQSDLNNFNTWCLENELQLNKDKFVAIRFHRKKSRR